MVIDTIVKAAHERRIVNIQYVDSKGKASSRAIEPYELKDDTLFGYCVAAQGIRAFKVARILSATPDTLTFEPRFDVKL